jgi:hypothetical protein
MGLGNKQAGADTISHTMTTFGNVAQAWRAFPLIRQ